MICEIADLKVDVPNLGDLKVRCKDYLSNGKADIIIDREKMKGESFKDLSKTENYYLESGFLFFRELLKFDGIMIHASAVVVDDNAYLFSGPCGMGKSTHAKLWQKAFGDRAVVINDDKPVLRRIDGRWLAYGTPWCGKDGINANKKALLKGICFLHRGDTKIRRLNSIEALSQLVYQTNGRSSMGKADLFLGLVDKLLKEIPIFEFYNNAKDEDALITFSTMNNL